jgi:hypothetical protein
VDGTVPHHRHISPWSRNDPRYEGTIHKVNGHHLKLFLDHDTAINEDVDVIELIHHDYILGLYRPLSIASHLYIASRTPLVLPRKERELAGLSPVRPNQGRRPCGPFLVA